MWRDSAAAEYRRMRIHDALDVGSAFADQVWIAVPFDAVAQDLTGQGRP